jgi:hypothetical protein
MKANLNEELSRIQGMMRSINEGFLKPEAKHDINKVMDFGYDYVSEHAPDGPKNKEQYLHAIEKLERDFNMVIKNLKGNIGAGEDEMQQDMPGFEGTMDGLNSLSIR